MMFILRKRLFWILLILISVSNLNAQTPVTTVSINTIKGLRYDVVRFKVKPGAKVRIILNNKDEMSHNLVITQPKSRFAVVNAALNLGENSLKMNYVPKISKVLWSTKVLLPGETTSLTFTAPQKEGVYPYVCTYPGHGFVMYGAMYVTNKAMPSIKNDHNIPPDSDESN
ncbi:MAG: plastocyanin/azurin family copper-binding protein [Ginsengibacter sp.]